MVMIDLFSWVFITIFNRSIWHQNPAEGSEGGGLCSSLGIGIGYNQIYAVVWVCPKMEYTILQYTPRIGFSIGKMTIKTLDLGVYHFQEDLLCCCY